MFTHDDRAHLTRNMMVQQEKITDYAQLADFVSQNPHQRQTVIDYFEAYERQEDHDAIEQVQYLQLKSIYAHDRWTYLNKLADYYSTDNKPSIAYMCLTESLRLNKNQPDVVIRLEAIEKNIKDKKPSKLLNNECAVSVIMSTQGKRIDSLKESLESILNQSFQDFEIILMNDGESDQVLDLVTKLDSPKIRYFKLDIHRGLSAALNEGIRRAKGQYIAYLDDDDVYYREHLEILLTGLKNSDSPIVYTNNNKVVGIMENGRYKKLRSVKVRDEAFDRKRLLSLTYVVMCSVMHRKDIFNQVGMFNEDLPMSMDWDFWLRCALKYDFEHISSCTSEYRMQEDSITGKNKIALDFFGYILPMYYAFYQGKIALLRYFIAYKQDLNVLPLYESIRDEYKMHFRTNDIIREVIKLAEHFEDNRFHDILLKDYILNDPGTYLHEIKRKKSMRMFIRAIPYLTGALLRKIRK